MVRKLVADIGLLTQADSNKQETTGNQQIKNHMKLNQVITGCALAAGLMAFAASNVQAGVVIDNSLYSPLNLKATVKYYDNNKVKQATETSKQLLKDLGFNGNVKLALGPSLSENWYDVYVINKDSVVANLTTSGLASVSQDESFYTYNEGNNNYKWQSEGTVSVNVNDGESDTFNVNGSGLYTEKYSSKWNDNNSNVNQNLNLKITDATGTSYVADLGSSLPTTISGSASGAGKIVD